MKSDIDRLLQERRLDALVVIGPDGLSEVNAPYGYFVGDAHVTGLVVKKRGEPALLLHADMERDGAVATGLEPVSFSRWPLKEIAETCDSRTAARLELYRRIFQDLAIAGRVAVTGVDETATALSFWSALGDAVPGLEIVAEPEDTVVETARLTKDAGEVAHLEAVARAACAVVEEVHDLLAEVVAGRREEDPLTIGRVRRFALERSHARGLQVPGGFILAANRDAGVPHSTGDDAHVLARGDVVLFDYWPKGSGGFYHDVTRTWTLGPPRPEVHGAFHAVLRCFGDILERVRPGASTRALQLRACEIFEEEGRPTIRQDPTRTAGYVHSLGHGLGLEVHEPPYFPTFRAGKDTILEPGMVVTIEPGLYDPERGYGVRIEDTMLVTETGARSLTGLPTSLEIVPDGSPAARRSPRRQVAIGG